MGMTDLEWAESIYFTFARGGPDETLRYLVVPGEPWSKARPRFSARGGYARTYQKRDDLEAESRMRDALRQMGEPFAGNVMVACRFYRSSAQRIDADNLIKHVCDSATGALWEDDSQVTLVMGELHLDTESPRTVIVVGNHASTLARGEDRRKICAHCGESYMPPVSRKRAEGRYCSRQCSYAARAVALEPVACPQCGVTFQRRTKTQVHCSRECGYATIRDRKKAASAPFSTCETCGTQLTHRRGGRCRSCWIKEPRHYT